MAGLGIGAIVIGLIIGIASILAYSKFTHQAVDEMTVAFSKKFTVDADA